MKQYISDFSWSKIYANLKKIGHIYSRNEAATKLFMEAVFWMMRTGAQWRELPKYYGNWNSIFARFNDWSKKNIWIILNNACIEDPDLEWVVIDSTTIKAHPCATGYYKTVLERKHLAAAREV